GVPPQESEAGTHDGGGNDGQIARVPHLVTARSHTGQYLAVLVHLPDGDQGVGAEDEHAGAGGQAVQTVGEVDGVGPGGDQEVRPDHEQDQPQYRTGEGQIEAQVPGEGDLGAGRGAELVVRELQGQDGEGDADETLTDHLPGGAQSQGSLPGDLGEVVQEADHAQAHYQQPQEQTRGARHIPGHQAGECVGDQRGHDDVHTAHSGSTTFGEVRRRAVLADELAVVAV